MLRGYLLSCVSTAVYTVVGNIPPPPLLNREETRVLKQPKCCVKLSLVVFSSRFLRTPCSSQPPPPHLMREESRANEAKSAPHPPYEGACGARPRVLAGSSSLGLLPLVALRHSI
jgi:hypothetical protein